MEPRPRELTFTGERVIPGQVEPDLYAEHLARYCCALPLARRRRVLDAGCGAGYGALLLREGGASLVVGVDNALEAIAYAREHYRVTGLHFLTGDCAALPFGTEQFDLVVAFEVIEHISDPVAFLHEVRRVLRRDGTLFLSTPNRRFSQEEREVPNPYHLKEYDEKEFQALLEAVFASVTLLGQSRLQGFLFHAPGAGPNVRLLPPADPDQSQPWPLESAQFFLAVCRPLPTADLPTPALFATTASDIVATLKEALQAERANLGEIIAERERHIALLEAERGRLEGELLRATAHIEDLGRRIQELQSLLEQPLLIRLIRRVVGRRRAPEGRAASGS